MFTHRLRVSTRPHLWTRSLFERRSHPSLPRLPRTVTREFHASTPRPDVFFVTLPAIKQSLLSITRIFLVILPFAYRWRVLKAYPQARKTLWRIPLLTFCLVLAFGLHQSPKTARWKMLLMTEGEELEWSEKHSREILEAEGSHVLQEGDPRVATVQEVASRLVQVLSEEHVHYGPASTSKISPAEVPRVRPSAQAGGVSMLFLPELSHPDSLISHRKWNIYVVDLPRVNTIVLPSREIFMYTGLLSVVDNDEELVAAVLAHEMIHVAERHSVERMGILALSGVLFDVFRSLSFAWTISFPLVSDTLAMGINYIDNIIGNFAYSQKLELEADLLGLELMAKAGYDPHGALRLWEFLIKLNIDLHTGQANNASRFLHTHPPAQERLDALRAKLPQAMVFYEAARSNKRLDIGTLQSMGPIQQLKRAR